MESDARFSHPIEFVKQHVLGCFEASKACPILPGKPHLYHVEFLKREGHHEVKDGSAIPLDFHLEAHFSPCEEVSWYLHTRENLPVFEGSVTVDPEYVVEHEVGDITEHIEPQEPTIEMWDERTKYMFDVAQVQTGRLSSLVEHLGALPKERSTLPTAPTTPENFTDTMTDTFGCQACSNGGTDLRVAHSRACRKRRSRFDKLNKELNR